MSSVLACVKAERGVRPISCECHGSRMACCRSNGMHAECHRGTHLLLSGKSEFFCRRVSSAGGMKGITTPEMR